ncbi:MAG: hypothetical protein MUC93_02750 [Bacteroidales bacterium]|jgi:hypothetical protein|nr:hypothetical protein [Bacteroidales bacterium]
MRLLKTIPVLAFVLFAYSGSVDAQCKAFAKKECLPELGGYTHDGNYHAAVLVEGEEAELYKTFYSDMEYRIAIVGEDKLPSIEFKILDVNKNVLYSNKDKDYAPTWDFKLQSSQQLKVVVKVTSFNKPGDTPASGCVAIMFGFKLKK